MFEFHLVGTTHTHMYRPSSAGRMDPDRNSYKCWAFLLLLLVVESAVINGQADASNSGLPVAFDTVPLGDFHIGTYAKEAASSNRFYFAPLALLEHTSASSGRNNLTGENQLVFRVEMWTEELLHVVKEHLSNVTGLAVAENKVSVLPFERVSMRCRRCGSSGTARPDSHWRSFSHGPKQMQFRLVCPTLEECRDLGQQMIHHPEQFSSQLTLYFRLDQKSLTSGSLRRKSASVSGEHVWNGPIMTDLNRRFSNSSFALVTAQDRARIVSEALENVLTDVEMLDDSDNLVIEPEDEIRLRRVLENLLFENYIIPLEEDQESSWDSLYWNYENAGSDVRPDVMARKLNKIYQNAEEKERKWMVQQVMQEPSGLTASAKNVVGDETLRALTNVFQTSPSRLSSRLEESRRTIQWERNHFAPRLAKLYRINLDKLRNSFKPVRNIPIKYSVVDMKLDLNVQPTMSRINFDRKPQIPKSNNFTAKGNEEIQELSQPAPASDPTGNEAGPGIFQGLFQTIRGAITGGGIETAPYTVLRKEKEYEERLYPAQKWVKTQMESISKDSASSAMFWKLFNYISGQNDKKIKIPMTAPVSVLIEPGSGPNCESTFTMAFYVPAAFQDDTPQPTESDVSIEERPEFKVLARTYGGFSNDRVTQQERQNLFDSLAEEDKQLVNQTGPYYYAGYDPPYKLFYRRNEVWMIPQPEFNLPLDAESQQHTVAKPISPCDEKNESDN